MSLCAYMSVYVGVSVCEGVCMMMCVYGCVCVCAGVSVCVSDSVCVYVWVWVSVCVSDSVYVYVWGCLCVLSMYVYVCAVCIMYVCVDKGIYVYVSVCGVVYMCLLSASTTKPQNWNTLWVERTTCRVEGHELPGCLRG